MNGNTNGRNLLTGKIHLTVLLVGVLNKLAKLFL